MVLVIACGPENRSASQNEMRAEAMRIAAEYTANPNLEQASAELATLDIANVNQWLKFVTEDAIKSNTDPNQTRSLVQLAVDLGVRSSTIDRFGIEAGMLQAQPTVEILAPAVSAVGQSSSSVIGAVSAVESTDAAENGTESNVENSLEDSTNTIELVPVEQTEQTNEVAAVEIEEAIDDEVASAVDAASNEEIVAETENTVEEEIEEIAADPIAVANAGMNVRAGPGVTYGIIGALQPGENATVIGKNELGDWWQVQLSTGVTGWLYSDLTSIEGNTNAVAVAANIPPPPTATPVPPTPFPTPTFTYAPPPTPYIPPTVAPPVVAAPPTAVPEPEKPVTSGNTFTLIERRLWGVAENGGFLAGESVNCGDKRELWVEVIDAAGNPLNGVTVHGVYTKVDVVTGSQGKGDGRAEYVLGDGEDIRILRDTDGSDASSDTAVGMVTKPHLIDFPSLIQAGYCKDDASCKKNVVDPYACGGHYSWTVKFQRGY